MDVRAGRLLESRPEEVNGAFMERLADYPGRTLAEVAESVLAREQKMKWVVASSSWDGGWHA